MLLVIDIGNTNIVLGVYDENHLIDSWRLGTKKGRTCDEYGILIKEILGFSSIECKKIKSAIISSVVPPLESTILQMAIKYFNIEPLIVGPGVKTGMPILYENPKEVGADRIVNSVAAFRKHNKPLIVVDFGTATTFDLVSKKGEYVGGVIAPGIGISVEALFQRASKLPRVDLIRPDKVVGKNTVNSIQSGIIYGYVGLVDGIVRKMKKEVKDIAMVIATGGFAKLIARESAEIDDVCENLTLDGLNMIFKMNER